jgi:tRNA (guanosine-2'-O-)-methyltransferase
MKFSHAESLSIDANLSVHYQLVLDHIGPLLTTERRQKIDRVVAGRNFETAVVLEGIYDRGNISAVMRTAEGLGFANFHVIETQEKFKEANRVTQGADKWVEVQKWKRQPSFTVITSAFNS